MSLSARRAWIEILASGRRGTGAEWSLSARRAWIEIFMRREISLMRPVALRKESVDRNNRRFRTVNNAKIVALRKESVDRNYYCDHDTDWIRASLSARRAWIEIDETT